MISSPGKMSMSQRQAVGMSQGDISMISSARQAVNISIMSSARKDVDFS